MRNALINTLVTLVTVVVCLMGAETAYRAYLHHYLPDRFAAPADTGKLPPIGVYNRSLWEYDADSGFRYTTKDVFLSHVDGGQVTSCFKIQSANAYGSMGTIKGDYASASLKVAVFGDSFTAFVTLDGMTWTNALQDALEAKLHRSVHVLNFGRDGTGVLQMFDMAKAKLPEYKPDLAIIAFISNDLARARIWRMETTINGELRVLTLPAPTEHPDPVNSEETFILEPEATFDWCKSMSYKGYLDRIGHGIEDKYRRFRQPVSMLHADAWSLKQSFLFDRIAHGDPFYSTKYDRKFAQRWLPGLTITDYSQDNQFLAAVKAVQATGIPTLLVHLPIYPEVVKNQEFLLDSREQGFLDSLKKTTGKEVYGLLDYVDKPVEKPERMNVTPENFHPSVWGMHFYADATVRLLEQRNLIPPPKTQ
jgi:hypothetical protein